MEESKNSDEQCDFDDEADDCLLVEAVESSVAGYQIDGNFSGFDDKNGDEMADISFGVENSTVKNTEGYDISGFDRSSGQLWIYPTNYPIRDYQFNIVQQALHRNTLVVLPTGLGKTFIAAVVMYNLYRWFPQGKIVFMAPTKPLVAQQIHACYNIMGIPKADTVEMTGNMHPSEREKQWRQKRVIFLTPQVMTNDLSRGSFAATSIKCLVVDEAHKALGNHAYCQVVRELLNFSQEFRVLALSATPGSDLKRVQQVMSNLLIAHIELRSEESIDIRPYTHERQVDKIVVPMGEELSGIRLQYIKIMETVVNRLIRNKVLYNREATKLSKFLILKAREEFRQNPPQNLQGPQYGNIEADFAMAMSIYHGFELLQLHGLRSLYNFLSGIQAGDKGYGRTRQELARNENFHCIMEALQEKFASKVLIGKGDEKDEKIAVGHPKMQHLEEIVVEHFKSFQENNMDTRVMIFSQYRDSVEEIRSILNQHQPLVKVMAFIGQSSVGKSCKGFSQKQQLKVMRQFREGGYNALVSTCVGEEGLDIGDVDLIVCFDAHKDPTRLVQRMGRTGRKRKGRIVMLVTQGKEEQIYNQSVYSKRSIHKAILNGAKTLHFYPNNPRLIPSDVKPKCHKMFITVKPETDNTKSSAKAKGKEKSKTGIQNISNAFNKARSKQSSSELSKAEYEEIRREFCHVSATARRLPRPKCAVLSGNNPEGDESSKGCGAVIDLSEWTPWQNRLQQSSCVGHSTQTHHLVQVYEFIELQQSIGEEGNSYGLEMELYLNKADVSRSSSQNPNKSISSRPEQSSITTFFTPSQKVKRGKQVSNTDVSAEKKSRTGTELGEIRLVASKGRKRRKDMFNQENDGGVECRNKNENGQLSDESMAKSVKSLHKSSNLFTVLKPVERDNVSDDDDVLFVNEVDVSNDASLTNNDRFDRVTIRRKKSKKKKLLDTKEGLWKDAILNESKTCTKKKKRSKNILKSVTADEENKEDFDIMDFEGKPEQSMNRNSSGGDISVNIHQKKSPRMNGLFVEYCDDPEEVYCLDSDFEETKKGDKPLPESCCDICMIPTPPRVEEVAEIFQHLKSPLDFTCLNVYELVDEWMNSEPCWKQLSSLNIKCQTNSSLDNSNEKQLVCMGGDGNGEMMVTDDSKHSSKEEEFKKVEKRDEEDMKFSPKSNVNTTRLICEPDIDLELNLNVDDFDGSQDAYVSSSTVKGYGCKKSTVFESIKTPLNDRKQLLAGTVKFQGHSSLNNMTPLSITVNNEHSTSGRLKHNKLLSPTGFVDSMDEVMQALDADGCFSPPMSTVNRTKPADVSLNNQSLATLSQALACLHSSSSDTLLSPNNLSFKKSSSTSPNFTQRKNDSVKEMVTPLGRNSNSKNGKLDKSSISTGKKKRNLLEEIDSKLERPQNNDMNNMTPQKLAKLEFQSFLDSDLDDDAFAGEIIPPTPDKSKTGMSFISSQKCPFSGSVKRNLGSCSSQNTEHSKTKIDLASNSFQNHSKPSEHLNQSPPVQKDKQTNRLSMANEQYVSLLEDSDDNDCIIVMASPDKMKLPFTSYENKQQDVEPMQMRCQLSASTPLVKDVLNNLPGQGVNAMLTMDNLLTPIKGHLPDEERDVEESFVIKRKSKLRAVLDFSSDNEPAYDDTSRKSSWLSSKRMSDEKKSSETSKEKSRSFEERQASYLEDFEDDDDFEDPGQIIPKRKPVAGPKKKSKPVKNLKKGTNFIDEEADVSGDGGTSDELEEGEDDVYEGSFINNDTEMTQADNTDMRAVYLKSVKSPVMGQLHGRYKFQFKGGNHSNIYSQALPEDHGMSEYEEDSFCVGSEEEDSPIQKTRKKKKGNQQKKEKSKKCVRLLSNSSSDEENVLPFTQEFTTNQRSLARKALMSSSDDEHNDDEVRAKALNKIDHFGEEKSLSTEGAEADVDQDSLNHENSDEFTNRPRCSMAPVTQPNRIAQIKSGISQTTVTTAEDLPILEMDNWLEDFDAVEMEECGTKAKNEISKLETQNSDSSRLVSEKFRKKSDTECFNKTNTGTTVYGESYVLNKTTKSVIGSKDFGHSISPPSQNLTKIGNVTSKGRDIEREERLKRQKEKQERFHLKLAQVRQATSPCSKVAKTSEVIKTDTSSAMSSSTPINVPVIGVKVKETLQILVDSKEISGAQEVISALRLKHDMSVTARQIGSCDYVLSNHLVVDRMYWSAFSNGSNRSRLTTRLCEMQSLYRKCAIVIEADRVKPGQEKNRRSLQHSKYLDRTMACIIQTGVKMYFTDSAEQTATLLSELCQTEQRKGRHLTVPTKLNPKKEGMFQFLTSIPQVNITEALNLTHRFSNLAEIISSPPVMLQKRGILPSEKAQWLYGYFRHRFDPQMTPVSYR